MLYCYTYTICYTYMTQVMGMAATENYYSAIGSLPYYGPPGVGLNAGVIMMNLTRMERMAGDGFTGAVRSGNTAQELLQSFFYTEKFIREETKIPNPGLEAPPPLSVHLFAFRDKLDHSTHILHILSAKFSSFFLL